MQLPVMIIGVVFKHPDRLILRRIQGRSPTADIQEEIDLAQNHYVTKSKRRQKSGKRNDPSAATMAKLRELAAADAKKSGK